jgi:hypothetical protein
MYEPEVTACQTLGLKYVVISYETLVNEKKPAKSVQYIAEQETPHVGIYRGWMLRPEYYEQLFDALDTKGISLINSPQAYRHTHYLPESYPVIESFTPESVWMKVENDVSIDEIMKLLSSFGSNSVIVKDYVKSQKHYWAHIPH